jgi:hypothetical protein
MTEMDEKRQQGRAASWHPVGTRCRQHGSGHSADFGSLAGISQWAGVDSNHRLVTAAAIAKTVAAAEPTAARLVHVARERAAALRRKPVNRSPIPPRRSEAACLARP